MVLIGPGRDGKLTVRVLESPAGEGEGMLGLPPLPAAWPQLRVGRRPASGHRAAGTFSAASPEPRRIGEELFRALFADQVGELFARSLGTVGDQGLRVRLRFQLDPRDARLAALHALPWELLRRPDSRDFLALSRRTPVVRSLEVPRPGAVVVAWPAALRILVVLAAEPGLPPLELAEERRAILEAWEGVAEVVVLEEGGLAELRQALLAGTFHVLHFMGHGELSGARGEGVLYFHEVGGWRPTSGEALAVVLRDFPDLRLVFLNACDSGRTPAGSGLDPFTGVATALALGGVPTVLAMQLQVQDEAAVVFSRTVYRRAAAGDPIEAAVAEGRLAVHALRPETAEWAIPILFTRAAAGPVAGRPAADHASRPADEAKAPLPRLRGAKARWALAFLGLAGVAVALVWGGDRWAAILGGADVPRLARVQVGGFWIGRYEVSHRDFARFVQARPAWRRDRIDPALHDGDYLKEWPSATTYPEGLADHPATRVSWFAARAFCGWAGGDLPTRKQWQAAAHTAEHRFPWRRTDPAGPAPLNFCDADCSQQYRDGTFLPSFRDGYSETAPVDAFPNGRSREGAFNLSGNVWEWCRDASGTERVAMGGSYLMRFEECSTDEEGRQTARLCASDVGFRCVWEKR